jgi:putative peptidoglycan lipid II flippase
MYYAYNDTRTPVYCSTLNLLAFVAVSVGLRNSFGHVAIAAGTSAGSFVQLAALALWLPRRIGPVGYSEVARAAAPVALASAVMGLVVHDVARLGRFDDASLWLRNLAVYSFTVLFGAAVFVAACMLLRVRELDDVTRALRRKRKAS